MKVKFRNDEKREPNYYVILEDRKWEDTIIRGCRSKKEAEQLFWKDRRSIGIIQGNAIRIIIKLRKPGHDVSYRDIRFKPEFHWEEDGDLYAWSPAEKEKQCTTKS